MKLQLITLTILSTLASLAMATASTEGMTKMTVIDNKNDKQNSQSASALLAAITGTSSYSVVKGKATLGYTHCTSRSLAKDTAMVDCSVDDKPGVYGTQAKALFKALEDAGVKPQTFEDHAGIATITVDNVGCSAYAEGSETVVVCDVEIYKK